jgi:hypothetical protein
MCAKQQKWKVLLSLFSTLSVLNEVLLSLYIFKLKQERKQITASVSAAEISVLNCTCHDHVPCHPKENVPCSCPLYPLSHPSEYHQDHLHLDGLQQTPGPGLPL